MLKISEQQEGRLAGVFDAIDADKNGKLSRGELAAIGSSKPCVGSMFVPCLIVHMRKHNTSPKAQSRPRITAQDPSLAHLPRAGRASSKLGEIRNY